MMRTALVPDGRGIDINGVKVIPIAAIEEYHRDDFQTFLIWLRGKTVMALDNNNVGI